MSSVVSKLGKELLGEKQGVLAALFWACSVAALRAETNIRMQKSVKNKRMGIIRD